MEKSFKFTINGYFLLTFALQTRIQILQIRIFIFLNWTLKIDQIVIKCILYFQDFHLKKQNFINIKCKKN